VHVAGGDLTSITELLDKVPLWGVFLASILIISLSMELGFQIGKRTQKTLTGEQRFRAGLIGAVRIK
jgi:hypothetical protein